MEIGTLLILLALLLSCATDLTRPFYKAAEPSLSEQDLELLDLREASQVAQKQLAELQEESALQRMDADDFTTQQNRLHAQIRLLQKQLETVLEADPIEQAVANERNRINSHTAQPQHLQTCTNCGEPIDPGHRFCPSCGQPQHHGERS